MHEFVPVAPTLLTNPAFQYLAEQREYALIESPGGGIMGAAHKGRTEEEFNSRPPPPLPQ